jgi:predicted NAD/FAD-binding protein
VRKRICIVGGGIAGLGAAWGLGHHPDRFDFVLYEKNERLGGNAMTVEIPQDDGTRIPIDISVTAYIPTEYRHYVQLLDRYGIKQLPTRFSYTVSYGKDIYAHDFESPLKTALKDEIARFQRALRFVDKWNWLSRRRSALLAALNPFNYIKMGRFLDWLGLSPAFRYKILKPMFVNFVLATNIFDMPTSMFCRYLEFFDIERATPMVTWDQGTANLYRHMTSGFGDRIRLGCGVKCIRRSADEVLIEDEQERIERFDEVIIACNANQALMMLEQPSRLERWLLGSVRYESELHNHAIVHTDARVLPDNETKPLDTRSNYIMQYGCRPDNYEITYIMHNQQPWAKRSDKPCLVTYNPVQEIDPKKIVARTWFQHPVHDVFHLAVTVPMFRFVQGRRRTHYCGAHVLINSQEHGFLSGLAAARQLGADYPFEGQDARNWFNFYGGLMHGSTFRRV